MSIFTWFTTVGLYETENMESLDCVTSGLFSCRMSVLRLVMFSLNGMHHSLSTGHLQPVNTSASDIFILAVCPSYIFTSSPL